MKATMIAKYLILSLFVFLTGCSPLAVKVHPTITAHASTLLPAPATSPMSTLSPLATETQAAVTETAIPPTITQAFVEQPNATSTLAATECQDAAQYITDDGLDGTTYAPNTAFTKTWTIKNTGSCAWDDSYLVSHVSGTDMTQQPAYSFIPQGQTVAPGQAVNIRVGMISPMGNGNYRSDWGLKKRDGPLMPVQGGVNGMSFFARIKVNDDSVASGNVTATSITIEREEGSGPVCTADATYFVHASVTTDGPTTASYEMLSSTGQISAGYFVSLNNANGSPSVSGTLVFDQTGTKTIDLRFIGPYPYPSDITVMIRVNGGEFHNSKLTC